MAAEQAKAQALQAFYAQLSNQLAESRTLEIEQRRHLVDASDELDALRKKHAREVMDLEMDKTKLQREIRELKEEIRVGTDDLNRERESVSVLKVCLFSSPSSMVIYFVTHRPPSRSSQPLNCRFRHKSQLFKQQIVAYMPH